MNTTLDARTTALRALTTVLMLLGGLAGCTSTPAPIVTPAPQTTTPTVQASSLWQGAPTPTPTLFPSISTNSQQNPSEPNLGASPGARHGASPSVGQATTSAQPTMPGQATAAYAALDGLRVAIDPGHNGGNFSNTMAIARNVPDGRGGTKACNTTGTATKNGYRESTFNLDVSQKLKVILAQHGATVTLTRDNDQGVGPCVDQRGAAGNDADVLVSIHANGSDDPAVRGWFLLYSSDPLNAQQGDPSRLLASHLAETLKAQGFPTNPVGPYTPRADIATINHSSAPVVMLELLEMKNTEDAALAQSPEAQQRYAQAIADGIANWAGDPRRTQ